MFAHDDHPMFLLGGHTLRAQRAGGAMDTPFKANAHPTARLLLPATALRVELSGRTERWALGHVDLKFLGGQAALIVVRRSGRRTDQLPGLGRGSGALAPPPVCPART